MLFFANLRRPLVAGYFVVQDAHGTLASLAASGYVYFPDQECTVRDPIGFGTFRALGRGFELWLTGVASRWRGYGHGRPLLAALLATPAGRMAWTVRVQANGASAPIMGRLLAEHGYAPQHRTPETWWYLRDDAPADFRERIAHSQSRYTDA